MNSKIIAKIGSSSAVLFILFLPLIGCQGEEITGIEIISHDDMWVEVKGFLIAAIACGVVILLLQKKIHIGITALCAVAALTIAFFIANDKNPMFVIKYGAYLALVGFLVAVVTSFASRQEES